jgi:hypothetical protein
MRQSQYRLDARTAVLLDLLVAHLDGLGLDATKSAALRYAIRHTCADLGLRPEGAPGEGPQKNPKNRRHPS